MWKSAVLVALVLCAVVCDAAYFKLIEGKRRCFLEEVPEDVVVLATYKSLDHATLNAQMEGSTADRAGIIITVSDPSHNELLRHTCDSEGRFAITSQTGGEHLICLETNTTNWFGRTRTFRFDLKVEFGEGATDYQELAKQEHLTAIEVELRKLNDKVKSIYAEQNYQKEREEAFRNTSESTNSRVAWWSVAQTVVLIVAAVYQVTNLKSFFRQKKLA